MDNQPFVFISYAHANSDVILPILKSMRNNRINLWYDEGIVAGSEWPEFIASKVVECEKFILFVSKAYINSQNCTRELNFAISRKKKILSIFLEDVELSPGMEMQLGTYQAIYRNRFTSDVDFTASLCREPFFESCMTDSTAPQSEAPQAPAPQPEPQPTYHQPKPQPTYQQPTQPRVGGDSARNTGRKISEPVSMDAAQNTGYNPETILVDDNTGFSSTTVTTSTPRNRNLAMILAFLLGGLGIQFFYMNNKILGILCLLFCWTKIPILIGIIHGILIYRMSDEEFESKCKS